MSLPPDIDLPFFAYGLFKPEQLGHSRIEECVLKTKEGETRGMLKL